MTRPTPGTTVRRTPLLTKELPEHLTVERPGARSNPSEHERLLVAAGTLVQARGGAGLTLSDILAEAGLSTRSFYRCFASKDGLIAELFTEGAVRETQRLARAAATTPGALEGVVAWIDARLELGFDYRVAAELQQMSLAAQSLRSSMPAVIQRAFTSMLEPLVEQLRRGQTDGTFADVDAPEYARSIHHVVWSSVERKWDGFPISRDSARKHVLHFCLPALGIPAVNVDRIVGYAPVHRIMKAGAR